jgi:uncharacterized repeat protein (TIGR03833 family)
MNNGEGKRDGRLRGNIVAGATVDIILKQDRQNGIKTRGTVAEILTGSSFHPHGIKVRLKDGKVGRVVAIVGDTVEQLRTSLQGSESASPAG